MNSWITKFILKGQLKIKEWQVFTISANSIASDETDAILPSPKQSPDLQKNIFVALLCMLT